MVTVVGRFGHLKPTCALICFYTGKDYTIVIHEQRKQDIEVSFSLDAELVITLDLNCLCWV